MTSYQYFNDKYKYNYYSKNICETEERIIHFLLIKVYKYKYF